MTSIAITGANGRMGRRLIALARESAVFTIVVAERVLRDWKLDELVATEVLTVV